MNLSCSLQYIINGLPYSIIISPAGTVTRKRNAHNLIIKVQISPYSNVQLDTKCVVGFL